MKKSHEIIYSILLLTIVISSSVFIWRKIYLQNYNDFSEKTTKNFTADLAISKADKKKEPASINGTKKSISLLFIGDLMFDRFIRDAAQKRGNGYIFEKIRDLLASEDLVIANLEGPITDKSSLSDGTIPGQKNHLIFTFDPSLAPALYNENIRIVNIGNNHIANFGAAGIGETRSNLEKNNIEYFGDTGTDDKYLIKNIGGIKIGLINYNQFVAGSFERTLDNIPAIKNQADIIIVYTHWGTEYKLTPGENIKNIAHKFIDEGADLVIGTHPHVIEPVEEYKSKKIYYSLGNFIFDQYFSEQSKKGLAVEVGINSDCSMQFKDINLSMENNGQTIVKP